jgi:hypothetical protein
MVDLASSCKTHDIYKHRSCTSSSSRQFYGYSPYTSV